MREGYCPTCGTRLNADGTEQAMVPAVTSEAVRETRLWRVLHGSYDKGMVDYLTGSAVALGLIRIVRDDGYRVREVELTSEGRVILAALQQPGLAAARWLAERLAPGGQRDNPELYATYQSAEAWRRAAYAATGEPAPEPGAER